MRLGGGSFSLIGNLFGGGIGRAISGAEMLSILLFLLGLMSAVMAAVLVYRGLVKGRGVSGKRILGTGIFLTAAWSLRLVWILALNAEYISYLLRNMSFIISLIEMCGLICAGVFLIKSRKKPPLARGALMVQTAALLLELATPIQYVRLAKIYGPSIIMRYLISVSSVLNLLAIAIGLFSGVILFLSFREKMKR